MTESAATMLFLDAAPERIAEAQGILIHPGSDALVGKIPGQIEHEIPIDAAVAEESRRRHVTALLAPCSAATGGCLRL